MDKQKALEHIERAEGILNCPICDSERRGIMKSESEFKGSENGKDISVFFTCGLNFTVKIKEYMAHTTVKNHVEVTVASKCSKTNLLIEKIISDVWFI